MIRHATLDEIAQIRALFEDEVRAGRMLPRSDEDIRATLGDWLVAEKVGQIVGCVSLVHFNADLCEVRSLAVHPTYRGNGIAGNLIEAALELARAQGRNRVLTLTRAARVFEQKGFRRDHVGHFPEKVWRDCAPCPFRDACDEVALVYHLRQETS